MGKALGHDGVSNEMLIVAQSVELVEILRVMFQAIFSSGHIPSHFNTAIVCPIPKGKIVPSAPGDFRPISISSSLATVFESLILGHAAGVLKKTHGNQFGYRTATSCKHAYFALNETIRYYQARGTSVHVASLDAEKAFDSLWRNGLFHKLIVRIPDLTWRALVTYYNQSLARARYNDQQTSTFAISGGVKQGGIRSPFLFNFFIDDLLKGCTDLRLGCKLGRSNVSILAYCDDIVLVSASLGQLRQLLLFY